MRVRAHLILILALAAPAFARAAEPAAPSAALAKGCSEKSAQPAEAPDVAANPAEFAGKCVRLEAWWRDIGL